MYKFEREKYRKRVLSPISSQTSKKILGVIAKLKAGDWIWILGEYSDPVKFVSANDLYVCYEDLGDDGHPYEESTYYWCVMRKLTVEEVQDMENKVKAAFNFYHT